MLLNWKRAVGSQGLNINMGKTLNKLNMKNLFIKIGLSDHTYLQGLCT